MLGTSSRNDDLGLRRGIFDITPSTWHLGLQLLHTAKGLHEAPKRIERLQPYLYRITPLTKWVNRCLTMSVLHPGGSSERSLLLYIWAILRVRTQIPCPIQGLQSTLFVLRPFIAVRSTRAVLSGAPPCKSSAQQLFSRHVQP